LFFILYDVNQCKVIKHDILLGHNQLGISYDFKTQY